MGNTTTKEIGKIDGDQVLRKAYNVEDSTMSVNGFIVGKVGHRITRTITNTNVANDTERFSFFDNAIQLYIIDVIYATGDREELIEVRRVA